MSAKFFLDTNVVAYAFDGSSPAKQRRAREIMQRNDWFVSWQVIQEFSNLALHRFAVPMKIGDLMDYLDLVLWPRCSVFPSANLYRSAAAIREKTQFRFYDSLIVASALVGGATFLQTDDLQAGRKLDVLEITNPFSAI